MLDDGLHQDGVAGDGIYGAQIPGLPGGHQTVTYYVLRPGPFGNHGHRYAALLTVQSGPPNLPPVLSHIAQWPAPATSAARHHPRRSPRTIWPFRVGHRTYSIARASP